MAPNFMTEFMIQVSRPGYTIQGTGDRSHETLYFQMPGKTRDVRGDTL
jgi:hypothetical protein